MPGDPSQEPFIETARLTLRRHRLVDFDEVVATWADPDVTRYTTGKPVSREEVWMRFLRNVGHWSLLGFGIWLVRERQSGAFVGEVGLARFERDIEPSFDAPEAAWVLAPRMQGRGYATEAVTAALAWFERRFGPTRTICQIHPDNAPSIRVAHKLGYRELLTTTYHGMPTLMFAREP